MSSVFASVRFYLSTLVGVHVEGTTLTMTTCVLFGLVGANFTDHSMLGCCDERPGVSFLNSDNVDHGNNTRKQHWDGGAHCFKRLRIHYGGRSIVAMVVDRVRILSAQSDSGD